jgi:dTDP-4-amino-4,6-dideoxygalactose transaminase
VRPEALAGGWSRDRIMAEVNARGVPCFSGTCPEIYREIAFAARGLTPQDRLPVAQVLGETSLMLLVHPTLDDEAMERAVDVVAGVVRRAAR